VSRARQLAAEAATTAAAAGAAFHELDAWYTVARLGDAAGVVDRVAAIALSIDGPLATLVAKHVQALADRDRAVLDRVAVELRGLGHCVAAAEAATAAHQLHQRAGDAAGASASAATVRNLLDRLDGVRTPGLAQGDVTDPLTAREREVATLAANGLTNKQIAGRLYVSVRTIDAHLRSVYSKLGVDGRGELSAALRLER
jgi:DNA-binding NarL/FixJ family response regulator